MLCDHLCSQRILFPWCPSSKFWGEWESSSRKIEMREKISFNEECIKKRCNRDRERKGIQHSQEKDETSETEVMKQVGS